MFSLLARLLLATQRIPGTILVLALIVTLASIAPVAQLRWELSLSDLLPADYPARTVQDSVQRKFGGLGTLTLVAHSPDSASNHRFIQLLADSLQNDPRINFLEYRTESAFYRRHKFLYIQLNDLQWIHDRIENLVNTRKARLNPFLVQIMPDSAPPPHLELADLEHKYLANLRDYLGNADGTIRVLEIYPSQAITDLAAMRLLYARVRQVEQSIPGPRPKIVYGGTAYDQVATGKTLLAEIRQSAWISAGIVLFLFLLRFFRHPQIPLLAAIPLGMATLWTLAGAGLLYERINLFTLLLGLVIPGVGSEMATHLLGRYSEERRKGLSPELAIESTLLGIGPPVTASAFISATAFFGLSLLPLAGLQELAIIAGCGILLSWIAMACVMPALLTLLQRRHPFKVYGEPIVRRRDYDARPFIPPRKLLIVLAFFSALMALHGFLPQINYSFSDTEYQKPGREAARLLEKAGLPSTEPAILLIPDAETSEALLNTLQKQMAKDTTPTIDRIATFSSLLPRDQEQKIRLLDEIHSMLTPEIIASLQGSDSANVARMVEYWGTEPLTVEDLPFTYQRKFQGRDGSLGEFGFIFPSIDPDDGAQCRRFANDAGAIRLPDGRVFHATGTAIIRAALLNLILPWLSQALFVIIAVILLLVLLFQLHFYRALLTLISPLVGFLWLLSLMRLLGLELNTYSALAFPFLIGMALDGALHLWHRYNEESTGSLYYIMRNTGVTVVLASSTTVIAFSGLLFSSHPGLRSMGLVTVLGLICLLAAHLTVFPLVAGWLDQRRYKIRGLTK